MEFLKRNQYSISIIEESLALAFFGFGWMYRKAVSISKRASVNASSAI
jgi:hypothetical protein